MAWSFSESGSWSDITVAVFVNVVPEGVAGGMFPMIWNVCTLPAAIEGALQSMVPPAPIAGVVQVNSDGPNWFSVTKVIVPGSVSLTVTFVAEAGPAFDRLIV